MTRLDRGWVRICAAMLLVTITSTGCATASRYNASLIGTPGQGAAARPDPALIAEFVKKLPVGSRVRISLADGRTIKGTLIRNDADPIVVQRRTRVPEAPLEIRTADVLGIELEQSGGGISGKALGIGMAAGAGLTFGVLMIVAAFLAGD
jgi:hypothetical protein